MTPEGPSKTTWMSSPPTGNWTRVPSSKTAPDAPILWFVDLLPLFCVTDPSDQMTPDGPSKTTWTFSPPLINWARVPSSKTAPDAPITWFVDLFPLFCVTDPSDQMTPEGPSKTTWMSSPPTGNWTRVPSSKTAPDAPILWFVDLLPLFCVTDPSDQMTPDGPSKTTWTFSPPCLNWARVPSSKTAPDAPITWLLERFALNWIFLPSFVTIPDGPATAMLSASSLVNCVLPFSLTMPDGPTRPACIGAEGRAALGVATGVGISAAEK